jgi:hypothetical protein
VSQPFPLPGYVERPCDPNNRVVFAKADDFGEMPPAGWGIFGGGLGLMTRCPKCGGRAGLDLHSVNARGEANPSYLCARSTCGFHVYVRLDGWDKGEKPARTQWTGAGWGPET